MESVDREVYVVKREGGRPKVDRCLDELVVMSCDSRHPILQTASDLIEIERPLSHLRLCEKSFMISDLKS